MRDPYPPIEPFRQEWLPVGDSHEIYVEQAGQPRGVPVIVLHGGPGSGIAPIMRQFFDPNYYRIILFDQRGAGQSRPSGLLENNSPMDLVNDIEKIRAHLGIQKWHVFGGSWGSTLALLYAQNHPDACLSLILRGIFLMQPSEIDWLYRLPNPIFPDAWAHYLKPLSEAERADPLASYYKRLMSPDPAMHLPAVVAWNTYETACSRLVPDHSALAQSQAIDPAAIARARIECHYFVQHLFEPRDLLLQQLDRIRHIPTTVVHGRYDIVCPITTAYQLHQAWPESDLIIVPDAGHSANDPPVQRTLVQVMENRKQLGKAVPLRA